MRMARGPCEHGAGYTEIVMLPWRAIMGQLLRSLASRSRRPRAAHKHDGPPVRPKPDLTRLQVGMAHYETGIEHRRSTFMGGRLTKGVGGIFCGTVDDWRGCKAFLIDREHDSVVGRFDEQPGDLLSNPDDENLRSLDTSQRLDIPSENRRLTFPWGSQLDIYAVLLAPRPRSAIDKC